MRIHRGIITALCAIALCACHDHHHHGHGHGHGHGHDKDHDHAKGDHTEDGHGHGEGTPYTTYAEHTELFVEVPTLMVGGAMELAAHVTLLKDFRPATEGRLFVELSGAGAPPERFEVEGVAQPGIFRPIITPVLPGKRTMSIRVRLGDIEDGHVIGKLRVARDESEAKVLKEAAEAGDEAEGEIGFTKEAQWRIDFATTPVAERTIRPSFDAYGTLRARPEGEALVSAPVAGRLTAGVQGQLPSIGQEIASGQTVATLVPQLPDAGDFAAMEQRAEEARLARKRAKRHLERLEGLLASGAVSEKKVIDARYEHDQATARYTTATRRMKQARRLQRNDGALPTSALRIPSPIDGVVTRLETLPGAFVDAGAPLVHIVDLDTLWLEVHVTETHAKFIESPKGVWFSVAGYDEVYERGPEHVVTVGSVLDPRTRTLPLYVAVDNAKRRLKVGMFADVHVLTEAPHRGLAVPYSAVLHESGQSVVYVSTGGEHFSRRLVRLGSRDGDMVEVLEGVTLGERVVSKGAYAVRLAAASVEVPEHGHHH